MISGFCHPLLFLRSPFLTSLIAASPHTKCDRISSPHAKTRSQHCRIYSHS
ncbi:hypothetical protein H6F96_20890 [Microcoleus sp. FACHB-53]|nr:hypothetical protein [Microcoleus sp. FACHB-53]